MEFSLFVDTNHRHFLMGRYIFFLVELFLLGITLFDDYLHSVTQQFVILKSVLDIFHINGFVCLYQRLKHLILK